MSHPLRFAPLLLLVASLACQHAAPAPEAPELILHSGKIVTVDKSFSIAQAIAIRGGRVLATGSDHNTPALKPAATKLVDLQGKTVIPGLIDSHVHPGAAMTEFDHPIPEMESV